MGTSTSHPGGLVPPWADGLAIGDEPEGPGTPPCSPPNEGEADDGAPSQTPDSQPDDEDIEGDGGAQVSGNLMAPRRERPNTRSLRSALQKFAQTGEREHLGKAIRAYGQAFRTKSTASSPSRTVVVGAGIIEVLDRLSRGEAPAIPGIQLGDLIGQPMEKVTALLIQALAPADPGFEEEVAEGAMADAMSIVLGNGTFTPEAIRGDMVGQLVCAFMIELVFKYLWLEIRHVAEKQPNAAARRDLETAGREVVRSVVERACDARRCAPMVERKSKAEIAIVLRDLSVEAAQYMRDYQ